MPFVPIARRLDQIPEPFGGAGVSEPWIPFLPSNFGTLGAPIETDRRMSKPVTIALRILPFLALSAVVGIWILVPPPTWFGLRGHLGLGIDKFAHAIGAGTLFAAALPAMRYLVPGGSFAKRALVAAVVLIVAGGLIELYQIPDPRRQADWGDFGANVVGITAVAVVLWAWGGAQRALRGMATEPSPALLRARRALAPLPLRFVEVGAVSDDRIRGDLENGEHPRLAQVAPAPPQPSKIQRIGRAARATPETPMASAGDRRPALPSARLGAHARRRLAALRKRSCELDAAGDPTRRGLRRRRVGSQRDSRRGAETRPRPYCRGPRHLRGG